MSEPAPKNSTVNCTGCCFIDGLWSFLVLIIGYPCAFLILLIDRHLNIGVVIQEIRAEHGRVLAREWGESLIVAFVLAMVIRTFLFQPFKIPSGSMIPTLLVGDLILVNKFEYGLRLPVIHTKVTQGRAPQRGDVMVFRYPPKPSLEYI